MVYLYIAISLLLLLSSLSIILSRNPIHSVLFLILVFISSSGILLLFEVEFLSMIFLIISHISSLPSNKISVGEILPQRLCLTLIKLIFSSSNTLFFNLSSSSLILVLRYASLFFKFNCSLAYALN